MKPIAIVGFGFCGRLTLFHLAQKLKPGSKVTIFEKNFDDTRGAAFSEFSPYYILNVPTIKMSAFTSLPKDFSEFLQKNYPQIYQQIGDNGFAPRYIYGKYLQQISNEAFAKAKQNQIDIEIVKEEVGAIEDGFLIKTKSGKTYEASEVMLATSFTQSSLPFALEGENFVRALWNKEALAFHQKQFDGGETICLIGSGLTAVDVIVGLKNKNFKGKIIVISRRGNFPKKHFATPQQNPDFIKVEDAKKGLLFLTLKIRQFLRINPQFDLRHVIDSIRPITQELWQNLDEKNKKLFLRFWPYWNIFRHRAPITSIEMIEGMIAAGDLELRKKGAKNITKKDRKFLVESDSDIIECDYIVNCLGFDLKASNYPLLKQMSEAKLLKKEVLLASSNHPQLHLLGGLNIGRDFECTAVPDLRAGVEDLLVS